MVPVLVPWKYVFSGIPAPSTIIFGDRVPTATDPTTDTELELVPLIGVITAPKTAAPAIAVIDTGVPDPTSWNTPTLDVVAR
jgi:hypothetical protein